MSPMPTAPRIAVLLSGSGSTLQNLIDRIADGRLTVSIVGVVSSSGQSFGVERAKRAGIPCRIIPPKPADGVFDAIREWSADLVVCAGWLHLLKVPDDYRHKVLNVHPSLLPAFGGKGMYGRHVHEAVIRYGAKLSGCTVHLIDDTYDTGPIVTQSAVSVLETDTPDTLAARVQEAEREAYPEAIQRIAAGGWKLDGRRVVFPG